MFGPSPITVGLPAILFRRIYKLPLIFWTLDLWPDSLKSVEAIRSKTIIFFVGWLVSFIYQRCDLILGQSKSFLPQLKKYSGHNRVKYFPGWAEEIFHKKPNFIAEKKIDTEKIDIMFAGNISNAQDFPAILESIKILKNDNQIKWLFVGDGRLLNWFKDEIQKNNLSSSVSFLGSYPIERMPEFFSKADALLITLKNEPIFAMTIPGKLQSYLMSGKPILAMLNGEGADLIRNFGCGLACNAGDSKSLANLVLKLKNMPPKERNIMGEKGLDLSFNEFNREMLLNKIAGYLIETKLEKT